MADSKGIITVIGRKKLCKAHAGDITLPPITQIAWGDGGVTEDGVPKATTGNEISLYNELLKDWHKEKTFCYSQIHSKKKEILWMNFEPEKQMCIFDY